MINCAPRGVLSTLGTEFGGNTGHAIRRRGNGRDDP